MMGALGAVAGLGSLSCGPKSSGGACDQGNGCPTEGSLKCDGDAVQTCQESSDGCLAWTTTSTCPQGTFCAGGGCCGDGEITGAEVCDGANVGIATCQSQSLGNGTLGCLASCDGFDTSGCDVQQNCGNGTQEGNEACDGADLGGLECADYGRYSGTLSCNTDCTMNISACTEYCGDGQINGTEDCDGNAIGTGSCASLGYYFGSITCDASCMYSTESCFENCGDGIINGTEACDGNDFGGLDCFDVTSQ